MNLRERNSPALSVCSEPTTRIGAAELRLACEFMEAMNERILSGASDFAFMKYTNLNRVWSSTSMSAYLWPPKKADTKGPTMSACTSRPACVGLYCECP